MKAFPTMVAALCLAWAILSTAQGSYVAKYQSHHAPSQQCHTAACTQNDQLGFKRRQILEEILAEVEEVEREKRGAHSHLAKATFHGITTHAGTTHGNHAETTTHVHYSEGPPAHDRHAEGPLPLSHGHNTREQQTDDHRYTRDAGPPAQGRYHTEDYVGGKAEAHGHQAGGKAQAHGFQAGGKAKAHGFHAEGEAHGHHSEVKVQVHGHHDEGKVEAHVPHAEGKAQAHGHRLKRDAEPLAQGRHHTEDHVGRQQAHGNAEGKVEVLGYYAEGAAQTHGRQFEGLHAEVKVENYGYHAEGKVLTEGYHAEGKALAHDHRYKREAAPAQGGGHHTEDYVGGHKGQQVHGHAEIKAQFHGHRQGEGGAQAHGHHAERNVQANGHHAEGSSFGNHAAGKAQATGYQFEGRAQAHGYHIEGKSQAHGHHLEHFGKRKREIADAINYLTQEVLDAEKEEIEKEVIFPRSKREIIAALLAELV